MKRAPYVAVGLTMVYLLLSFNAYACLVPLYGGAQVAQRSDCSMPQEQPARQHCDAFKTLGVQTVASFQPLPDISSHAFSLVGTPPSIEAAISLHLYRGASPPLFTHDPLALTSVLRL